MYHLTDLVLAYIAFITVLSKYNVSVWTRTQSTMIIPAYNRDGKSFVSGK